jgi:hypothetical protein
MPAKLINVRLAAEDAAKAKALMAEGVKLSALIREAIRTEYEKRQVRRRKGLDFEQALKEIDARFPIPDDWPPLPVDSRDRVAAREWILQHAARRKRTTKKAAS